MRPKSTTLNVQARTGDIIHERMIPLRPPMNGNDDVDRYHTTASQPALATDIPTMAPTAEWVVDTGSPYMVAASSQIPAVKSTTNIPYISRDRKSVV
jgi:hypothetical protein